MEVYQKNISWRVRKIAKKNILINGIETYELDDIAVYFYKKFNGVDDLNSIAKDISENYQIDLETAYTDLLEFSRELLSKNIIESVESINEAK